MRRRLALAGLALVLAVAGAVFALPKTGSNAPAWSGTTLAGKAIKSSAYRGKVVLLNFYSRY